MHAIDAGSKLPTWHPSHARHPRVWQLHALGAPASLLQGLLHHPALLALHECSSHRVLMKSLLPWQSCKEAQAPLHEAAVGVASFHTLPQGRHPG